jgi:hypothetical protein
MGTFVVIQHVIELNGQLVKHNIYLSLRKL